MEDVKQVIVVRTDYKDKNGDVMKIRRGKQISQACHASIAFLTNKLRQMQVDFASETHGGYSLKDKYFSDAEWDWINGKFTKICLQVSSEQELEEIHQKAIGAGLTSNLITDSGLTEFHGIPTKTCLAIGPDEASKIDLVTGGLKLL